MVRGLSKDCAMDFIFTQRIHMYSILLFRLPVDVVFTYTYIIPKQIITHIPNQGERRALEADNMPQSRTTYLWRPTRQKESGYGVKESRLYLSSFSKLSLA